MIKDNWKPKICNSNKEFPYLIIDNWYKEISHDMVCYILIKVFLI